MVNQTKRDFVKHIVELLEANNNFALISFDKTPHQKLEELRKNLSENDADIQVIKNTLLEKAINILSTKNKLYNEFKKTAFPLKQVTALLVLKNDWSKGLKAFYEFCQKEKSLAFKNGLVENVAYDGDHILRMAKLPAKNQLIANILGSLKNPTSRFILTIKNPMQKLVYILKSKSN